MMSAQTERHNHPPDDGAGPMASLLVRLLTPRKALRLHYGPDQVQRLSRYQIEGIYALATLTGVEQSWETS